MPPSLSRRRGLQAFGLFAAAALTQAACGKSGDSPSDSSSGGLAKLTVIRSPAATFEPLIIAQDQGYFAKQGLSVTFLEAAAGGGATSIPRVLKGEAQIAMADIAGVGTAVSQGLPIKAISTIQLSTATDPVSDGLLVNKDSAIKGYADLAGKKVGLSALGGFPQAFVTIGAAKAGVDISQIKFVQLPTASLTDSLKKGDVDAIISFAAFYDAAKLAGMIPVGNGSNDVPGVPQALLFAGTAWIAKNRELVTKFQTAVTQGYTYANANPDTVRSIDKKYTELDASYIDKRTLQKFGGTPDQAEVKTVLDALVTLKSITKAPDFSDLYDSSAA